MFKFYENNGKILLNFEGDERFAIGSVKEANSSDFDKALMKEYLSDLFYKK